MLSESKQAETVPMNGETQFIAKPGEQIVTVIHTFDAPRTKVFDIANDPKLIPEWWGPKELKTVVQRMKQKPGGTWRIVQTDPKGTEFAFHGVIHSFVQHEMVVRTSEYEGMPGHVVLETYKYEGEDGKTKVTSTSVFQSVEDRDMMIMYEMKRGVVESMERLASLIAAR